MMAGDEENMNDHKKKGAREEKIVFLHVDRWYPLFFSRFSKSALYFLLDNNK